MADAIDLIPKTKSKTDGETETWSVPLGTQGAVNTGSGTTNCNRFKN